MTLSGFSQTDIKASKKNNSNSNGQICLSREVLLKAAADIIRYERDSTTLNHMEENERILNEELRLNDSIIQEMTWKISLKDDVIKTWNKKYVVSEAYGADQEKKRLAIQKDYTKLKKNDRIKMGIALGIILIAVGGWASSASH